MTAVPVLEVGGTHVTAATVDSQLWQVIAGSVRRFGLDSHAPEGDLLAAFAAAAKTQPADDDSVWGIAMPDPFDYRHGIARFRDVGKFESLDGVAIRPALSSRDIPGRFAFVNDADAFLLGEWTAGAARGAERATALTLGTGVGSSWLANGAIVDSGPNVPQDGRAHRIHVDGVPLEDRMSRRAIRAAYGAATGDRAATGDEAANETGIDVREIADRARAGDPIAAEVLDDALRFLGTAIGPYLRRFRPDVLVIGGSMAASWELFEPSFRATAGDAVPRTVVAADPEHAPLIGAAVASVRHE